jgi:hypothetical protein
VELLLTLCLSYTINKQALVKVGSDIPVFLVEKEIMNELVLRLCFAIV